LIRSLTPQQDFGELSRVAAGNALAVAVQQIGVNIGQEENLSVLYHQKFVCSFDPNHPPGLARSI